MQPYARVELDPKQAQWPGWQKHCKNALARAQSHTAETGTQVSLHPKDGERNRLCRPARVAGMNSSRFHMTTSSAKAFPVSLAGRGEVKNKQNTDGMGKSANALPWQREEMTKRRINHISGLTGCSQGKKCSFCLDLDSEVCDSAVAYGLNLCLQVHQVEGQSDLILWLWSLEEHGGRKWSHHIRH